MKLNVHIEADDEGALVAKDEKSLKVTSLKYWKPLSKWVDGTCRRSIFRFVRYNLY